MQKVVGSSPIIRLRKPRLAGLFVRLAVEASAPEEAEQSEDEDDDQDDPEHTH